MDWKYENTSSLLLYKLHLTNDAQQRAPLITSQLAAVITFVWNILGIPLQSAGICANIINLVVFSKQGFKDTINISFTALAVSDLGGLVHTLWTTISLFPSVQYAELSFSVNEIVYVTGSVPRIYFNRISCLVTMYIAVERCISVTKPLQVKFLFTKRRTTIHMIGLFVANIIFFVPPILTTQLAWKWDSLRNRTYFGVVFLRNKQILNEIGIVFSTFLSLFNFISVLLCTIILVYSLLKQSKWRVHMSATDSSQTTKAETEESNPVDCSNNRKKETKKKIQTNKKKEDFLSGRDKRAVTTVTVLAVIFISCYFPGFVGQIIMLIVPDFSRSGPYRNTYYLFWLFCIRTETLCASINIAVYYNTGTKFKEILIQVFCPCLQKEK